MKHKLLTIAMIVAGLTLPYMASAANPFNNINDQLDQLNTEVTEIDDRVTINANNISTNTSDISANTTAINNLRSVHVHVNGVRRGALLDAYRSPNEHNVFTSSAYRVLLNSEYFAMIMVAGDGLKQVSLGYESEDCNGQAYFGKGGWNDLVARQGILYSNASPAPGTLYMIQAGTAMEVVQVESWTLDGVCTTESLPDTDAYKAVANEPAITGVTQGDFVGEVTLGF